MKKFKGSRSHHAAEIAELAANRELAMEYLNAALQSLDDPDDRAAGLLALRTVAEAYGGRRMRRPYATACQRRRMPRPGEQLP